MWVDRVILVLSDFLFWFAYIDSEICADTAVAMQKRGGKLKEMCMIINSIL